MPPHVMCHLPPVICPQLDTLRRIMNHALIVLSTSLFCSKGLSLTYPIYDTTCQLSHATLQLSMTTLQIIMILHIYNLFLGQLVIV